MVPSATAPGTWKERRGGPGRAPTPSLSTPTPHTPHPTPATHREHGFDTKQQVVPVVERIKHAEDVDPRGVRLARKRFDHVVGVTRVPHRVGAAQQHLKGDVGDGGAQGVEAGPGALVQEAEGDVESGAAPHLEARRPGQRVRGGGRGGDEVVGAHAGGEQGLVRVAPRGVGQEEALVRAHRLGPALGALLEEDVAPAGRRGPGRRQRRLGRARRGRRADRARVRRAVHHHARQIGEQLGRLHGIRREIKQGRVALDEGRGGGAR
jgi:hypothetical protein